MVKSGKMLNLERDRIVLKPADETGWTVAHQMASQGYRFDPVKHPDILLLKDKKGRTVAEAQGMAKNKIKEIQKNLEKILKRVLKKYPATAYSCSL